MYRRMQRFLKAFFVGGTILIIGYACYFDVAPMWLVLSTYGFCIVVGIIVYIVDPRIGFIDGE
jgi:hypothetical protein